MPKGRLPSNSEYMNSQKRLRTHKKEVKPETVARKKAAIDKHLKEKTYAFGEFKARQNNFYFLLFSDEYKKMYEKTLSKKGFKLNFDEILRAPGLEGLEDSVRLISEKGKKMAKENKTVNWKQFVRAEWENEVESKLYLFYRELKKRKVPNDLIGIEWFN